LLDRTGIIAEARSWIGTRYRHQQSLKGVGCDCLGLLRGVWRAVYGSEPEPVPAYTSDWAEASGEETLLEAAHRHLIIVPAPHLALPGDVLLFRWKPHLPAKHCAVLVAGSVAPRAGQAGRIVHAYDAAGQVTESNVASEWEARIAGVFAFPGAGELARPFSPGRQDPA
jgi:NlpC/P60 family putative phage cell wall peptidase